MFVLLIHYFIEDKGMEVKIIKVDCLRDETSNSVVNYIFDTLKENNIPLNKCIAFGADNTNCNFGGLERRGVENIFYKLKQKLPNIRDAGCSAHVLHNSARKACEALTVDVELVVIKIFSFFKSFTLRTERLKEFCEFVDIEYHHILSHSKIRWLTLMPAVERIIKMYEGLKSFFLSTENAPNFLTKFFTNPLREAYLWTVHSFLSCFNSQILKIEKESITIIEIRAIMNETVRSITSRICDKFLPLKTKEILRNCELESQIIDDFKNEIFKCYLIAKTYLNKWIEPLNQFSFLQWMLLEEVPEWDEVSTCLESCKNVISCNEDVFYNQFCYIKDIIETEIAADSDKWKSQSCVEKWMGIFGKIKYLEQKIEFVRLCSYVFSIPSHNASCERVFSLITSQWTDERNRLDIGTVNAIISCVFNMREKKCRDFFKEIESNKELLTAAQCSEKYSWYNKK